jgi:thiol-disulfide isomerase/thioredoxin
MKKINLNSCFLFGLFVLFAHIQSKAQTITACFSGLVGQRIQLGYFDGLKTKTIDSANADKNGYFNFTLPTIKPGMGFIISEEKTPFLFVIDTKENIQLNGVNFSAPESIKIISGKQNQLFAKYAIEHPKREQALSAWRYLQKIYTNDSLFHRDKKAQKFIGFECKKIKQNDENFLKNLNQKSYLAWYLPMRGIISNVSTIAQYRTEEIAPTVLAFRELNYSDQRLYNSGLLKDAIESHFWLIENSGKDLDSVFIEMKTSIDAMLNYLIKDEKKLNEITNHLFDYLEKRSLFKASEYLALKVLNEVSCTLNNDLAKQLETYRAMKKGNVAPDFSFPDNTFFPKQINQPKLNKLSDIKTPYTLVVFGASNCPKCVSEIPQIKDLYSKWKSNGLEVVFVSLDENQESFEKFSAVFPFISTCDFNKWKSPIVESYYVFGTPTMFLLDNKREILLRPNSVKHMDSWLDWFLINKNPQPNR